MRAWRETRGRAVRAFFTWLSSHERAHVSAGGREAGDSLWAELVLMPWSSSDAVPLYFPGIRNKPIKCEDPRRSGILRDSLEVLLTGWRNTWCHVFTDKLGGMSASRFPSAHLFVNASQCVRARPRWLRRWANPSRSLCDGKTQTFPRMILKARSPVKLGSL